METKPLPATTADGKTALDILGSPELLELMVQLQRSAPALTQIMARIEALKATGGLDGLLELLDALGAAQCSMTDGMIARLADKGRVAMELVDALMLSGVTERLPAMLAAMQAANAEARSDPHFVNPLEVLTAPRGPEMQYVIKFLLAVARRMPAAMGA